MSGSSTASDHMGTWILHNPIRPWTLAGLSAREARLVLETLSMTEKRVLQVTREFKSSWYKLEDAFCAPITMSLKEFAPPANLPVIPNELEQETTTVHLLMQSKVFKDRKFDRLFIQLPVEIIAAGQSFQSVTEDISEGGLRVKDLLPDWIAGYFVTIVKTSERNFEMHCSIVEDQKKDRYRIEIVAPENDSQYVSYCEWVKSQKDRK